MEVAEKFQEQMKLEAKDTTINMPANVINLQRCLMTLNGVATTTGAGNVRPSAMWRRQADALLAREGGD